MVARLFMDALGALGGEVTEDLVFMYGCVWYV